MTLLPDSSMPGLASGLDALASDFRRVLSAFWLGLALPRAPAVWAFSISMPVWAVSLGTFRCVAF